MHATESGSIMQHMQQLGALLTPQSVQFPYPRERERERTKSHHGSREMIDKIVS